MPGRGEVQVAADVSVFAHIDGEMHVLLVRRLNDPFAGTLSLPGGYVVAAGLAQGLEYIESLHFSDEALRYMRESGICSQRLCRRLAHERFDLDVDAVPEGTVVLPNEPLLRVDGRR